LHNDRGTLLARLGHFTEARDDFIEAIKLAPDNHRYWHDGLMPLLLELGELDEFQKRLVQELAQFKTTTDGEAAHRVAKDALCIPLEGDQLKTAMELADRALALLQDNHRRSWAFQTKGMAEYRSGHYQDAIRSLEDQKRLTGDLKFQAEANLFIAMCYERLGDHARAQAQLNDALHTIQVDLPNPGEDLPFPDWIICDVNRREAEALINGQGPSTRPAATTQGVGLN